MNILIANASHYQSGGDWTYIDTITKIYVSKGHKVVHFVCTPSTTKKIGADKDTLDIFGSIVY